jgi:[ribosomal protein S5]-alanine N-acetyltransferase
MTVLEGRSVRLRPADRADLEGIFSWYNDPEIVAPHDRFSTDTFDEFVHAVESAPHDLVSLAPRFVVETVADRDVVGVVGHYRPHPVLESVDVWYILGKLEARGHGFGREAVGLLTDHLFATETIERVGATVDVDNAPSCRLLEAIGFRREGTLRSALFHHGRWHAVHVYGVNRAERAQPAPAG